MPKTLKPGDKVTWDHSQGTTTGHVVRKITGPAKIKGHKVAATAENPEFIVKSDKTGALAAHKPGELRKGKAPSGR
jgi:plastocyanin